MAGKRSRAVCRCLFWTTLHYVSWLLLAATKQNTWCQVSRAAMAYCCFCGKRMQEVKDA